MSSLPLKVLASIVVATFARASPADAAKKSKHKKSPPHPQPREPIRNTEGLISFPPVHFISVALSASSFCGTSAVDLAAMIDRPVCLTKAL